MAGAACSDKIIPRNASWGTPYPPVLEYEIPAFEADLSADANGTDTPYFDPPLTADSAVYSIWIGTNDVGEGAFLTDNQTAGATLTDFTDCVYESLDAVYAAGGRYFVLQNLIPLQLAPEYSNTSSFDVVAGIGDPVQVAEKMEEYVTTINNVYKYQTPYEVLVSGRYAGAHFAVFDVYSLVSPADIVRSGKTLNTGGTGLRHLYQSKRLPERYTHAERDRCRNWVCW